MYKKFKYCSLSRKIFLIFNTLFFIFLTAAVIVPLLRILSDSLINKTSYGFDFFTQKPDICAYKEILTAKYMHFFVRGIFVSLFSTAVTVFFGIIVTSISAYILTQREMPGVKLFARLILFTSLFNAGLIPEYIVMKKIGLYGSLWAVILPMCLNVFSVFLLKSYMEKLPRDILDAAEIDGCSPVKKLFVVIMPMLRAPLAAVGLFFAAAAWNEYFRYLIYTSSYEDKCNLQYFVRTIPHTYDGFWMHVRSNWQTLTSAAVVLAIIPALIAFPIFMKFYTPIYGGKNE